MSLNPFDVMKKIVLGGHRVSIYDSIDELPMVRFHKYSKMLLVDAGVGSDINDFDAHIERAVRYFRKGDNENGAKELENLRQCVYLILSEQSVRDLSLACLVAEIDGKPQDDLSEEGLAKVVTMLGGTPRKDFTASSEEVKKKIDQELVTYFPDLFDDACAREYYDTMKRRTQAVLDNIIEGETEERDRAIEDLTERMVLYVRPKVFAGRQSVEIQHDKAFESMCLTISRETHTEAKRMTVMEYYNAYEFIRRMSKERQKAGAKGII